MSRLPELRTTGPPETRPRHTALGQLGARRARVLRVQPRAWSVHKMAVEGTPRSRDLWHRRVQWGDGKYPHVGTCRSPQCHRQIVLEGTGWTQTALWAGRQALGRSPRPWRAVGVLVPTVLDAGARAVAPQRPLLSTPRARTTPAGPVSHGGGAEVGNPQLEVTGRRDHLVPPWDAHNSSWAPVRVDTGQSGRVAARRWLRALVRDCGPAACEPHALGWWPC